MKLKFLTILGIIILGAFFRFYKLDWGQGLFAHPDEYHIVGAVNQLSFPNQMNPHFFSYGTVTIYLIYFTQQLIQILSHSSLIINPFLIGRFYSAIFSTLTIFVVYKICRSFMQTRTSYLAALLVAITPGLVQQAHFATPESAQIFFLFGSLLFLIKFVKQNKIPYLVLASLFFGLSVGVKVSSTVLLLPLAVTALIRSYSKTSFVKTLFKFICFMLIITVIAAATLALVAPFAFLDFPAFKSNLDYEGGLAVGKFLVFYTRQFVDTTPVLFQIEKIFPYALGQFLLLISSVGLLLILIKIIRKPRVELSIVVIGFLSLFIANAFLFARWTRFVSPTFPFFAIFASYLLENLYSKYKHIARSLTIILLITTFLWAVAFFSIYLRPDVRITASNWIENNVPKNSSILVEGGNMIDVPLSGPFIKTSLDFYNLETDPQARLKVANGLESIDYFLVQSRRVFMNHQRLLKLYPKTANFYNALFAGKLGFDEIKEFHSYPMLKFGKWKIEFPDEKAEETWSVFDHPVIRVFKKTKQMSKEDYAKFLEI